MARVRIRNFKSIGKCEVGLSPLTFLVGRNGAGKSNFIDALRFIADGLQPSLDHAIKARGGVEAVRRISTGHPRNFAIEVELNLQFPLTATYGFEIAAKPKGAFAVKCEQLVVRKGDGKRESYFRVERGKVLESSVEHMPPASADRLYLGNAAGLPTFRPVFDALSAMGFYNLNPEAMKGHQVPDAGELLHRDGRNIASVLARLAVDSPSVLERIHNYLRNVVEGIVDVRRVQLGQFETLKFRQEIVGAADPWNFYATSMSDGTLRALGSLVAVAQLTGRESPIRLVGIEEPETALHPAAAGALVDALREAAERTQVLVTTHSPDLLDQLDGEQGGLLAVTSHGGATAIAPIDAASRTSLKEHLYFAGELLRMDQLSPDAEDLQRQEQLVMQFDAGIAT